MGLLIIFTLVIFIPLVIMNIKTHDQSFNSYFWAFVLSLLFGSLFMMFGSLLYNATVFAEYAPKSVERIEPMLLDDEYYVIAQQDGHDYRLTFIDKKAHESQSFLSENFSQVEAPEDEAYIEIQNMRYASDVARFMFMYVGPEQQVVFHGPASMIDFNI